VPLIPIAMALAQFAPGIIKLLTGSDKAEAVAGKVVDIARTVTGTDTPEAALAAIQADPNKILEFQQAFNAQQADIEKAYLADVADARARDVEFIRSGRHNVRADLMIVLDALGLLACVAALFFYRNEMSGEVVALLSTIASIFGLCLRDAHQFEFGSSRGSKEKDEVLATSLKTSSEARKPR